MLAYVLRPLAVVLVAIVVAGLDLPWASAAELFTELRTFPGVVLVPSEGLMPFDGLEPWRVELNRPLRNAPPTTPPRGRYLVQYRDSSGGDGSAQIGGVIGGAEFDQTQRTHSGLSFRRCAAEAAYCTENVGGQDGTPPASELFRGLSVGSSTAVAEHVVCCGGHYWSLAWYDAGRDMTYELVLVGPVADLYGTEISRNNRQAAETIAALAGQLVVLQ